MMDPLLLIEQHYPTGTLAHRVMVAHGREVAELAGAIAREVSRREPVDVAFVIEAAWLHDIGIGLTATPRLGCFGDAPYITHGILGAELLRKAGLPRHALACERHIGVGLSLKDIEQQKLPLPLREMCPQTLEEEIVAYADLFFSKKPDGSGGLKSADAVRSKLARYGLNKLEIFEHWHGRFGGGHP